MLFIGDRETKRFRKMITPSEIIRDKDNELIVEDVRGFYHKLYFENAKQLAETLSALRHEGRATAICEYECPSIGDKINTYGRELEYNNEIDDIDFEIER